MAQTIVPYHKHISKIAKTYKVWLCDIWGVLHDGETSSQSAMDACRAYQDAGGRIVLITNAPRPAHSVRAQFAQFGVEDDIYDAIVASGDVTVDLLKTYKDKKIFHLGPARDKPILESAGVTPVSAQDGELILCSGLYDDNVETSDDYIDLFKPLLARKLPLICANPDIKVERGNRLVYCGGALAALYKEMGGDVIYAGKPYTPIYDLALAKAAKWFDKPLQASDILCIGDGVHTDILGAVNHQFDCLYIGSNLYGDKSAKVSDGTFDALFDGFATKPIGFQTDLTW